VSKEPAASISSAIRRAPLGFSETLLPDYIHGDKNEKTTIKIETTRYGYVHHMWDNR
jgi:hypothetical protein